MSDETWLRIFQTVFTWALVVTVVSAILTTVFSRRIANGLRGKIATADRTTAERPKQLEVYAEELKKQNLQLGLDLEKERLARLEIERRLGPRFLTTDEEKNIVNALLLYAGHTVSVTTAAGDAEARNYGKQIIGCFAQANWNVESNFAGSISPSVYGMRISVSDYPDEAILALINSLEKEGVRPVIVKRKGAPPESLRLVVGLKPPN